MYRKEFDSSEYSFFCEACESYVKSTAKHCGSCNRCVSKFDHHCRWLNNCVGETNYKHFFRLIVAVFLLLVFHNACDIAVLIQVNQE